MLGPLLELCPYKKAFVEEEVELGIRDRHGRHKLAVLRWYNWYVPARVAADVALQCSQHIALMPGERRQAFLVLSHGSIDVRGLGIFMQFNAVVPIFGAHHL